ncbi:hypothetical protein V5O48_002190 [Marasmius crinis-equi]|uniref:Uncharacterized protein n=1 Tax=Marasmius crinis-equi TaxID=585013 RepID=A0ABR3FW75_9AGAR
MIPNILVDNMVRRYIQTLAVIGEGWEVGGKKMTEFEGRQRAWKSKEQEFRNDLERRSRTLNASANSGPPHPHLVQPHNGQQTPGHAHAHAHGGQDGTRVTMTELFAATGRDPSIRMSDGRGVIATVEDLRDLLRMYRDGEGRVHG